MLDPTIAEILLAPELRGHAARSFGAAVSLIFEIVLRDGFLPIAEAPTASRLSDAGYKDVGAHLLSSGLFYTEGDFLRSRVADAIVKRNTVTVPWYMTLHRETTPAAAVAPADRKRSAKPSPAPGSYEKDFEEFWSRYKAIGGTTTMNKAQSAKSFGAAIGRGATVEDILTGLDRYAKHQAALIAASASKRAFVKMPTTWLNQSEWTAEYPDVVAEKPAGTRDPEGAPEPKLGVDFFQKTVRERAPDGGTFLVIQESVYEQGHVRFWKAGWLRSKGFPIAAEKWAEKEAADRSRRGEPFVEPDRTREPVEDRDFYVPDDPNGERAGEYWTGTTILFDRSLWKLGHGEP